ncbi:sodium:proton exchanger [Streptomyces sp. NPDC096176]|uniref:sodium:proton exchanger n=1 Tax=Streptomyces sp. NPDC096176 TaxID=3366079 RepID=UPI0038037A85
MIDPVGGILGALAFHALVSAGSEPPDVYAIGGFLTGTAVGLAGGLVGTGLLWLALRVLRLGELLGTLAQLAVVVAVSAGCDLLFDDTGLIAAIVMGLAVANLPGLDLPARRQFFETLVQLIIGLLFVSISATVTPVLVTPVLLPSLALVAVLVLVVRPLTAWLSTSRTGLGAGERAFIGWMAPRGIVAASTAAAFSAPLADAGLDSAGKILPITFLVIVGTVLIYSLTAVPVARRLGVARSARACPLLVGGDGWAVDLGRALRSAGLEVLMWAGPQEQRQRIREAGIELAAGELVAAAGDPAQLEGITAVLLLTDDDFNAVVSMMVRDTVDGPVHRVAPLSDDDGAVAPYAGGGDILFGRGTTRRTQSERYAQGARFRAKPASGPLGPEDEPLFVVRADGRLDPVTATPPASIAEGDTVVLLGAPTTGPEGREP